VDLSSRYTDEYPDVIKLKEQIAKTEKVRKELLAAPKKPVDEAAGSREIDGLETNAPLAQLQGQFKANQLEISNREHRIDELQGESTNTSTAQCSTCDRATICGSERGTSSRSQSTMIFEEKNSSEMATSMEQLQEGEHFTVLDLQACR